MIVMVIFLVTACCARSVCSHGHSALAKYDAHASPAGHIGTSTCPQFLLVYKSNMFNHINTYNCTT